MRANPYTFAVTEYDLRETNLHCAIACKLSDGGFDIGPMLWTASPDIYSQDEKRELWKKEFKRAGIERMEQGYDDEKGRYWFKVYSKQ